MSIRVSAVGDDVALSTAPQTDGSNRDVATDNGGCPPRPDADRRIVAAVSCTMDMIEAERCCLVGVLDVFHRRSPASVYTCSPVRTITAGRDRLAFGDFLPSQDIDAVTS